MSSRGWVSKLNTMCTYLIRHVNNCNTWQRTVHTGIVCDADYTWCKFRQRELIQVYVLEEEKNYPEMEKIRQTKIFLDQDPKFLMKLSWGIIARLVSRLVRRLTPFMKLCS